MKTTMTMVGPGMYSQRTGPCDDCGGQGQTIDEKNRCKECNGKKTTKERKIINVEVDKGAPNGERYVFHGEADQHPDIEAGDVVIQVQEQPHKTFKRKGADLLYEKEITLLQALTGVDFVLTHLDGRKIRVKNEPGQVIKPEDIKTVEGFGMPFHKTSYRFGNLFVLFKIKFPDHLEPEQVAGIKEALATQKPKDTDMDADEVVTLTKFTENHKNTNPEGGVHGSGDSDDDDDEDGHGGQRVRCAQQ